MKKLYRNKQLAAFGDTSNQREITGNKERIGVIFEVGGNKVGKLGRNNVIVVERYYDLWKVRL